MYCVLCVVWSEVNAVTVAGLPWKPAVERGWPADQVEIVSFVDSQGLMDVTVRIDIRSHRPIQRQAAEKQEAGAACHQ